MNDAARQSRATGSKFPELKNAEPIEQRRNSIHDDDGSLSERLTLEFWTKKDNDKSKQSHRSRPSTELFQKNLALNGLTEPQYNFSLNEILPSPTGLRHRISKDIETATSERLEKVIEPSLVELNGAFAADSDDSEFQLIWNEAQDKGYESDASNITTISIGSNWDHYFLDKKKPPDIWLERGEHNLSETPSVASDWDEAGFATDGSEMMDAKGITLRTLSNRASGSIEIVDRPGTILVVCKKNNHVTRARTISMDTTLATLASWINSDKSAESLAQHRKENFSYNFKRYNSAKLGVSIGELFTKPIDSSIQGLLIFYGPINGKLTYKILLTKMKELRRLCKQDGIDFTRIWTEKSESPAKRRDTFEEIKLDQQLPKLDNADELKLELPTKRKKYRTVDL